MHRGAIAALGTGVALMFAGCGQTDYATDVTTDSAQLNGTITTLTENVVTTAWFEYWPTANPSNTERTPDQNITSTGPIHADIGGLDKQTEYQYRLCGTEDDSQVVCAQTRRLTTGRDAVQAYGFLTISGQTGVERYYDLDVDLVSSSSGLSGPAFVVQRFTGTFGDLPFPLGSHTAPDFTCFEINGNTAVIGVRNTSDDGQVTVHSFIELVDGGPLGSGQDAIVAHINELPGEGDRDPTDCSPLTEAPQPLDAGEIVISQAGSAPE